MHSPRIYSLHLPPQGPLRPTRTDHGIQPLSCLPISRALSDTSRTHLRPWPCSVYRLLSTKAGLTLGKQRGGPRTWAEPSRGLYGHLPFPQGKHGSQKAYGLWGLH